MTNYTEIEELLLKDTDSMSDDQRELKGIYNSCKFYIDNEKNKLKVSKTIHEANEISQNIHKLECEMFKIMNEYKIKCLSSISTDNIRFLNVDKGKSININLYSKFNTQTEYKTLTINNNDYDKLFAHRDIYEKTENVRIDRVLHHDDNILILKVSYKKYNSYFSRTNIGFFNLFINKDYEIKCSDFLPLSDTRLQNKKGYIILNNGRYGLVDEKLNTILECSYGAIYNSKNKYLIVYNNGLYGYYDISSKKIIIKEMFTQASQFVNGIATVKLPNCDLVFKINTLGEIIH